MNEPRVTMGAGTAHLSEDAKEKLAQEIEALRTKLDELLAGEDLDVGLSCLQNKVAMLALQNNVCLQTVVQNLFSIWSYLSIELQSKGISVPGIMTIAVDLEQDPNG